MTAKQWPAIRKEAGIPETAEVTWTYAWTLDPYASPSTCQGQRNEAIGKADGLLNSIYCSLTSVQIADRKIRLPNQ
jgi:hypothetical protein